MRGRRLVRRSQITAMSTGITESFKKCLPSMGVRERSAPAAGTRSYGSCRREDRRTFALDARGEFVEFVGFVGFIGFVGNRERPK